jgi:hypothetical protein
MFQFPRCPSSLLYIQRVMPEVRSGGFPHSDIPGYVACSRLPETFRSDPRPSSALGAKASTVSHCSFPRDTENTILFFSCSFSLAFLRCAFASFFLPYSAVNVHQTSCCLEAVGGPLPSFSVLRQGQRTPANVRAIYTNQPGSPPG